MPKNSSGNFFVRVNLDGSRRLKIRPFRWAACMVLVLLFLVSYGLDIQMLEGSMIASRLMGFHMVDIFSGLEVIGAHGKIATNLLLGMIFVASVYLIVGGRTFCSWVCPYGLLSEWAESLHKYLVQKGWIRKRKKISTKWKFLIAAGFLVSSCLSGYLVYQYVNLVGIVSRIFIYGLLETSLIVLFVLGVEVFFYQRFWCRAVCPSGAALGLLGKAALIRLRADQTRCDQCGKCVAACHAPEALKPVFTKEGKKVFLMSSDCTLCAKCMDVCDRDVFEYAHRLSRFI